MDRNTPKRKWRRDSLVYDNESELCSTDYEDYVPMASLASIRSFRSSSSAKELVIELEADDKDKAETSTKKSAPISGVEPPAAKPRATVATNTAPTNTETNGLSSDTRQKLLDECKSKLKGKPGNSKLTTTSHLPRKINQEIKRGEPDRKNKSIKPKPLLKDIGVSSAPAKDILRSNKGGLKPTAIQREYVARSIATIKPFMGSMKHSVKDVEANVVEIGDHNFTNVKCHYSSSETTNSDEYYFYKKSVVLPMVPGGKTHQVYATMKTFDHVRAALACQRADIQGEEKPDTPCLCQNCGVLGVLVESQKRPIVTHSVEKLSDSSWTKLKQNTDKRNISPPYHWKEKFSEEVINNLCERVRILELRVQEQEQKAVPRDYFKRVINKIVSYINPKYDFKFDQPCKPHKITTSTQCSTPASKRDVCCKQRRKENVYVQAVLIEQNTQPLTNHRSSAVATENKENILPTHKFTERELGYMSSIWKWGEEVIKPGSDLKHKVVALVDEKLNYIKQPISNKPESTLKMDCDSDKTIFLKGSDDKQASTTHKTVKEPKRDQVSSQQPVPGNNFQKFLDVMSAKIYTDFIQQKSGEALDATAGPRDVNKAVNDDVFKQNIKMQKGKQLRTTPKFPRSHITPAIVPDVLTKQTGVKNKSNIPVRKAMERQMSPMQTLDSQEKLVVKQYTSRNTTNTNAPVEKDAMRGKATNESTVHITYMNPKAKSWFRESSGYKSDNKSMSSRRSRASDVVKLDSLIEEGISRKRQEAEKSGMAKLLSPKSKAKHESIWQAIWNQARAHGKSKQDKVTVQVPADPAADGRGVKEVELTLADLESIVQKHASI